MKGTKFKKYKPKGEKKYKPTKKQIQEDLYLVRKSL